MKRIAFRFSDFLQTSALRSLRKQNFFEGFVDYHCHVLPDVDDGICSMSDALEVLRLYEDLGVKGLWLTPHVMEDIPNTTDFLRRRFDELRDAYKGSLELHLAAEYMLDLVFFERLEHDDLLPIVDDKHILVETSYLLPQNDLFSALDSVIRKGYIPILAHPERYQYVRDADLERMKELGVKFQLNLPSLGAFYGKPVRKRAKRFLKMGLYSFYGSDLHRVGMLMRLAEMKTSSLKALAM